MAVCWLACFALDAIGATTDLELISCRNNVAECTPTRHATNFFPGIAVDCGNTSNNQPLKEAISRTT